MIYWLFTNGRESLSGLLIPLLCLTPILLLITATMMGAGIRRTSDERAKSSALRRGMLIVTYAVILLTITTFYLTVLGDQAVQRGRSNTSGVIELLVGAPPGINTMRLFLFGDVSGVHPHDHSHRAAQLTAQRRLAAREDRPLALRQWSNAGRWGRRTSVPCASTAASVEPIPTA